MLKTFFSRDYFMLNVLVVIAFFAEGMRRIIHSMDPVYGYVYSFGYYVTDNFPFAALLVIFFIASLYARDMDHSGRIPFVSKLLSITNGTYLIALPFLVYAFLSERACSLGYYVSSGSSGYLSCFGESVILDIISGTVLVLIGVKTVLLFVHLKKIRSTKGGGILEEKDPQ